MGWQAVAGRSYQVQFCSGDLASGPVFSNAGSPVVATSAYMSVTVPADHLANRGHLRVRLVE